MSQTWLVSSSVEAAKGHWGATQRLTLTTRGVRTAGCAQLLVENPVQEAGAVT